MKISKLFVALLALAFALPVHGDGGGTVSNVAAETTTLSADSSTVEVGSTTVLTGTVTDLNKVDDLDKIKAVATGDLSSTVESSALSGVSIPTSKPGSDNAGTGWKVWDPSAGDGILNFEYTTASYSGAGSITWTVSTSDEAGYGTTTRNVPVTVVELIKTYTDVFDDDGTSDGSTWGGWTAAPTDTDVAASNWVKIENTGTTNSQGYTLSFSGDFTKSGGSTDIGVGSSNIQFRTVEVSAGQSPDDGTPSAWATSTDGSLSSSFTATGNLEYVQYRILAMPGILEDGTYSAGFTVVAT